MLQIAASHKSVRYNTYLPPPSYSKLFLQILSMILSVATLKRGGGGITSTRSWTGHFDQSTVKCLKYFCNWFSHLTFTSKSDLNVSTSQNKDLSDLNK